MDYARIFEHIEKNSLVFQKKLEVRLCSGMDQVIGLPYIRLLGLIKNSEQCIVTDIANYLNITLSAVTGLVDRLVEMEMVERIRSEKDRRIVEVVLTEKGMDALNKVKENSIKIFNKCFSYFTDEEVETYFKVLDKISECILSDNEE